MKMLCKLQFTSACCTSRFRSAAAVWIVIMAVITMTSSPARAECIGTMVALGKGEAALRCPLTVNVRATRHSVVVRYFPEQESSSEDVMDCHWPTEEAKDPDCYSKYNFSLGSELTDQVVAKAPESSLNGNGTFKCELLPASTNQSSTRCQLHYFHDDDKAKQPVATDKPVVPPLSSDSDTPDQKPLERETSHYKAKQPAATDKPVVSALSSDGDTPDQKPLERETSHCAEQSHDTAMTVAMLGLQIIICLLLAVNVFIIRRQKNQRPKSAYEVNKVYAERANPHPPPDTQYPLLNGDIKRQLDDIFTQPTTMTVTGESS